MKDASGADLSYAKSGVNIDAGNALVEHIKALTPSTHRPGVLGGIGGFAGLFELPAGYHQPVLVSGTDGVGTKLKLAIELQRFDTIGIDLVAMCVNDIIVTGAEPLFFLDYYATGKLDVAVGSDIVRGIAEGCKQAHMALIGGETAEMPRLYQEGDFDLAGFCVGVVEKSHIIEGKKRIQAGDVLIGMASSGIHSNGYSLIHLLLEKTGAQLNDRLNATTPLSLGEALLTPTRIYVSSLRALQKAVDVRALAHITGGGLLENLPRVMPEHTRAIINAQAWDKPAIFDWIEAQGVPQNELWRTFNNGIGMVVCVPKDHEERALKSLQASGERAWPIGYVEEQSETTPSVHIQ